MIKPKYSNISDSISDFRQMLEGMNDTQPLERTSKDDLSDLIKDEQSIIRLTQQIEHVLSALNASGMQMSKTEASNIMDMHNQAATMYNQAADKAQGRMRVAQKSGNEAMLSKMREIHTRLRRMAGEHESKARKQQESLAMFSESANGKEVSMSTYRQLAGIELVEASIIDPGRLGSTKINY
jgi:hypothetical protein